MPLLAAYRVIETENRSHLSGLLSLLILNLAVGFPERYTWEMLLRLPATMESFFPARGTKKYSS